MVSSDAAALCVCPWLFTSTNKIYLYFTQYFLHILHETMYNKTIIEFGFCDIRNNQGRVYFRGGKLAGSEQNVLLHQWLN